jgi:hypothetical protein
MKAVALLLLFSVAALGQETKPHIDKTEWALLAADASARSLDVYSTHWALKAGNKEGTLPGWIADHPPVMALYSGGMVAGQYFVARKLSPRHRKLAHFITAMDITVTAPFAVHNLFLPVCVSPNVYTAQGCQVPTPGVTYK